MAQMNEAKRAAAPARKPASRKHEEAGITQEQIKTLLQDKDIPVDSDDNLAPENSVNAFEGVEDW